MIQAPFSLSKFHTSLWKKILNISVLSFFCYYLYSHLYLFDVLKNISYIDIFYLIALNFISTSILGYVFFLIFKSQKVIIKEFYPLQLASVFLNSFLPKGGTIFRACFLKEKYNVSYSAFSSSFLSITISLLLSCAIILCLSVSLSQGTPPYAAFPILAALLIIFIALFILDILKQFLPTKIKDISTKFMQGWKLFKKNKLIFTSVTLLISCMTIIAAWQFFIIFHALGVNDLNASDSLIMSTIKLLSVVFSVTPNGLGPQEALLVLTSSKIISAELIILSSLILHATSYLTNTIIGLPAYYYLTRVRTKTKPPSID